MLLYLSNRYCFPHFFFVFTYMNTEHTKYYLLSVFKSEEKKSVFESTAFQRFIWFLIMQHSFVEQMNPIYGVDLQHVKMKIMNSFRIRIFFSFRWKTIFLWNISGEGHVIKTLIKTNIPSSSSSLFAWEHLIVYCQGGNIR